MKKRINLNEVELLRDYTGAELLARQQNDLLYEPWQLDGKELNEKSILTSLFTREERDEFWDLWKLIPPTLFEVAEKWGWGMSKLINVAATAWLSSEAIRKKYFNFLRFLKNLPSDSDVLKEVERS